MSIRVTIKKDDKMIFVKSPYEPSLPSRARQIGGDWDSDGMQWCFDVRDESKAHELYHDIYGEFGETSLQIADVRIKYCDLNTTYAKKSGIYIGGRCIARARGRDSGARIGEGVALVGCRASSGGSRINWTTSLIMENTNEDDAYIEIKDVPLEKAEYLKETYKATILGNETQVKVPVASTLTNDGLIAELKRRGLSPHTAFPEVAFIQYYDFDYEQMGEIRVGFENGLIQEQVALYAKPEFDRWQMQEIRVGLEAGLTQEQIDLYAKTEFDYDYEQMQQIRVGFENGLTQEQIAVYAKPKFDRGQMREIRFGLKAGLTQEQIDVYAKPKFDDEQMWQIRYGFVNGLSIEQIALYAKTEFDDEQMQQIRFGLEAQEEQGMEV